MMKQSSSTKLPRTLFRLQTAAFVLAFIMAVAPASMANAQSHVRRQRLKRVSVCGNPQVVCNTTARFQPNDLPIRVPKHGVIVEALPFYAIILKSIASQHDSCDVFIPEIERLTAQELFPDHKVFSSRCTDPVNLFYEDVGSRKNAIPSFEQRIMAVYAGASLAEAKRFLETVKATGKFPGANLRRMRTGFNGT